MNKIIQDNPIEYKHYQSNHLWAKISPKSQKQCIETLVEHLNKHNLRPIKLTIDHFKANSPNQRGSSTESETKNKTFDKTKINSNRLKISIFSKSPNEEIIDNRKFDRDSQLFQLNKEKEKLESLKKNMFFNHFISSPKQKLQSLKNHLKTVREQNQTYLKNKMTLIKQKIKRKRQKLPTQQTKPSFWQNKHDKTVCQKQTKMLKIEKYDENEEQELIRKSIQIHKEQIQSFHQSCRDSFTIQQQTKAQNKQQVAIVSQKQNESTTSSVQQNDKLTLKDRLKSIFKIQCERNQEISKMMIVSRLNPRIKIDSDIKPQSQFKKHNLKSEHSEIQHCFNIKTFNKTLGPQKRAHKYSKSFDISLIKRVQKRSNQQIPAHNFIRGSVIYRLLKQRINSKSNETLKFQAESQRRAVEKDQIIIQNQEQNLEEAQKQMKKRKKVVLSIKNVKQYKNQAEKRERQGWQQNIPDQNQLYVRSQLFFEPS